MSKGSNVILTTLKLLQHVQKEQKCKENIQLEII